MNAPVPHPDVDALLLLSFGGPEKTEDIIPFLENVTRGRGIPKERLEIVGEHYKHFNGYSPLNDCNREIIANIESELRARGLALPVYFGNRNWEPFANTAGELVSLDGHQKVAVFATSAWGGYSGCRQYGEDIEKIRDHLSDLELAQPVFIRLRQFFDHPEFIAATVTAVEEAYATFAHNGVGRGDIQLVFTAHSIPVPADQASGTDLDGTLYSNQVREASRLTAQALGITNYDVVWQSASGDGSIPWLEPDILDYAEAKHAEGVMNLLVCPIGFISDHMEVVWDLDHELVAEATARGQQVVRATTVGHTRQFASMVLSLIDETLRPETARHEGHVVSKGCIIDGTSCEPDCCVPPRRRR